MQDDIREKDRLRRIKVLSFDGDMTLWDFEAVMRFSLGRALQELRKYIPDCELTIDRMIEIRNAVAKEFANQSSSLEQIRMEAFIRTLSTVGSRDRELAAYLNAVYLRHRFEDTQLYPDVLPALNVLSARYTVGLVSNGNSYPEQSGLKGRFNFVIFAQDIGIEKPHPALFRMVFDKTGCAPDELMHVGDSLKADVQGANGVGAISVWLNRLRQPRHSDIKPDFEIYMLSELQLLLDCGKLEAE